MAEIHGHTDGPTVITDGNGSNALIAVIGVVLVGALIWLVAFSGMVFDRNGGSAPRDVTNIENNNQAPPAQPAPQEPAPAQS